MYLTWFDVNTWLLEIGGKRVLIDPWFVGSFLFGNQDWFFKGSRAAEVAIPESIDLIVLSQGLEDHTHVPTLKQLNRQIPVVASPNAAKVVQSLGYAHVTTLEHGQSFVCDRAIAIKALPGSPVGPTLIENGYLIEEISSGTRLYYEPHGYHSPLLKQELPIDITIIPILNQTLPIVGAFIRGNEKALEVAKWVQPKVMINTAATGDAIFEGFLTRFLKTVGSGDEFRALLAKNNLDIEVIEPRSNHRFALELKPRQPTAI